MCLLALDWSALLVVTVVPNKKPAAPPEVVFRQKRRFGLSDAQSMEASGGEKCRLDRSAENGQYPFVTAANSIQ